MLIKSARYFSDLYFATSYWPLIRLLRAAPDGLVLASPGHRARRSPSALEVADPASHRSRSFACCAVALFRQAAVDIRRFGAMVACISLTAFTTGSAGYVQIFLLLSFVL